MTRSCVAEASSGRVSRWLVPPSVLLLITLAGCDSGIRLAGDAGDAEPQPDASDVPPDGDGPDDGGMADDSGDALSDGSDSSEGDDDIGPDAPACPVWASPVAIGGTPDGSRARPYLGVQPAIERRGDCDHVVLLVGPSREAFAGGVDISLVAGNHLLIEGDASSGTDQAAIDGADSLFGMRVTGEGSLSLRHLAVRGGRNGKGGCLEADVAELFLEDTSWEDCTAEDRGGAVWVRARSVSVAASRFRGNAAGAATVGAGGAIAVEGTADTLFVATGSVFRENQAAQGGAVAVLAPSVDVILEGSRFVANVSLVAGSAVYGYLGGRIIGNRFESNVGGLQGGAVAGRAGWYLAELAQNVFAANSTRNVDSGGTSCCGAAAAVDLSPAYITIRNNLFVRNVSLPDPTYGSAGVGAVRCTGGSPRVVNNTFVENEGAVPDLVGDNGDVRNNLFVGSVSPVAINETDGGGEARVDYNNVWPAPAPFFAGDAVIGAGNLAGDPAFLSPPMDDFRLGAGSPCIDAGDPSGEYRDGDGTRNDIGAFGGPGGAWTPLEGEEGSP